MTTKRQIEKRINTIVRQEGRRPRILLAHLESDSSDRWAKPLAATLAEWGFDVDFSPANQTPATVARLAIDHDVHLVCVSLSDIANQPLLVELLEALNAQGGADIRLVAGSKDLTPARGELNRLVGDLIVDFDIPNVHLVVQLLDRIEESYGKPEH